MRRSARHPERPPAPARQRSRRPSRAPRKRVRRILRFTMPSRRQEVAAAVERILSAIAPAGLEQDQLDSLAVAVAEALSNAVVHGNRMKEAAPVRVVVTVLPGSSAV